MIRKADEGTEQTESSISQIGVGRLDIKTVTFESGGQTRFSREITIRKDEGKAGWGKIIFLGSLQELLDLTEQGLIQAEKER